MRSTRLFLCVAIGFFGKVGLAEVAPAKFLARMDLDSQHQGSIVLIDVNHDGILDIVASVPTQVWLGNGDGTFRELPGQPAAREQPIPSAAKSSGSAILLSVIDVNGDGKLDLVAGVESSWQILVQFGDGEGAFQSPGTLFPVSGRPLSLAVADVNGDGRPDVVVGTGAGLDVLFNDGKGGFTLACVYAGGQSVGAVAVRDLNGDGIPDIAFGVDGKVQFLLGTGRGSFIYGGSLNVSGLPSSLLFADFNCDYKLDLAVVSSAVNSPGLVTIFYGTGHREFGPPQLLPVPSILQMVVGDVNHDGRPDLVAIQYNPEGVIVLLNRGDGTFQASGNYAVAASAVDLAVGSLRNDGLLDIVVTGLWLTM